MPQSERSVSLHKAAGERTLIGLQQRKGGTVCISSVAYDSPLAGNVHPCDIITAINGAPVSKAQDVAAKLVEASTLELTVLTPLDVETVFVQPDLNIELAQDKKSGLPKVTASREAPSPNGVVTQDLERQDSLEALFPGDLICAIGASDGVVYAVDSPKAVLAHLREAQSGGHDRLIEVRVVRDELLHGRPTPSDRSPTYEVTRAVARSAVRRETPDMVHYQERRPSREEYYATGTSGRSSPSSSASPASYSGDEEVLLDVGARSLTLQQSPGSGRNGRRPRDMTVVERRKSGLEQVVL